MKSMSFHQANQVMQLQAEFQTMRDELVTGINSLAEAREEDIRTAVTNETSATPAPPSANATTDMNAQMIQILHQM